LRFTWSALQQTNAIIKRICGPSYLSLKLALKAKRNLLKKKWVLSGLINL
jgi:hypothetical protein